MWDTTVGLGAMKIKKDAETERKNGLGVVALCCEHLPQLSVRAGKTRK